MQVVKTAVSILRGDRYAWCYQINGINRYMTFCRYSRYPVSSFSSNASSFLIRFTIRRGYIRNTRNAHSEPKTIGMYR